MNRREFGKLLASLLVIPSLGLSICSGIPSRYRGFNVCVDKMWKWGIYCKQVYVSNGDYHCAMLFSEDQSDTEIWKIFQSFLDRAIDKRLAA